MIIIAAAIVLVAYLLAALGTGAVGLAVNGEDRVERFHERITFNLWDLSRDPDPLYTVEDDSTPEETPTTPANGNETNTPDASGQPQATSEPTAQAETPTPDGADNNRPSGTGTLRTSGVPQEVDPAGGTVEEGGIAVVRVTDNSEGIIYVDVVNLEGGEEFRPGMVASHAWYGYSSLEHAYRDACGEAHARLAETTVRGNWNFGYQVLLNGKKVPESCT